MNSISVSTYQNQLELYDVFDIESLQAHFSNEPIPLVLSGYCVLPRKFGIGSRQPAAGSQNDNRQLCMRRLANPHVAWAQVIYAMNVTQPSGQANLQNEFATAEMSILRRVFAPPTATGGSIGCEFDISVSPLP
jgi:hypothetical protein